MKQTVDARGQACPQPVVGTLKALAAGADEVTTIVDNAAAVENVTRLAHSKGFEVSLAQRADGAYLTLTRAGAATPAAAPQPAPALQGAAPAVAAAGPLVVFVSSDSLGRGSAELGERLLAAFFHTLLEIAPQPQTVIFMNSGVKLAAQGSRALEDLRALADRGVEVLSCGACLSYYELSEKLAVGRVSNMYELATLLLEAGRVVEL